MKHTHQPIRPSRGWTLAVTIVFCGLAAVASGQEIQQAAPQAQGLAAGNLPNAASPSPFPQAPTPQAQAASSQATIADLQRRVEELDAAMRRMQAERNANLPAAAAAPAPAPAATVVGVAAPAPPAYTAAADPAVTSNVPPRPTEREGMHTGGFPLAGWNNGFYLHSADNSYDLHITGQLQADYREFLTHVDTASSPDTFLIRRARLGIEATMFQYYEFRLLPDFAGTSISKSITDAYVNVHYWDGLQFEAGKFKQPVSYEQLIQDRYVPTMERSMMDQLTPQRDEGLMVHGRKLFDDRMDYAVAVSNGEINGSTIDGNNGKDVNGRIVFRPFNDPCCDVLRHLQFGVSGGAGIEEEAISPNTITTPATVEWFIYNSGSSTTANLTTGKVTTTSTSVLADGLRTRVTPELTYFYHSLGFAAQYYQEDQEMRLSTAKNSVNVHFDGYYFLATYLLTGEQRYDYSQQIDPLRPFSQYAPGACPGAWELVARVSRLDVSQNAFTAGLATLGQSSPGATELTTGVNWYLNKWVRAQFNYEHAWFDDPVQIGNAPRPFTKEDAVYTRLQLIF